MKPINFKESNKYLEKPKNMSDDECSALHIFNDKKQCISCWNASIFERIKFLFSGNIWLSILSGTTQPPVWVSIKYPFKKEK